MNTKQAKELLRRYQTGNINPSEKELVERWFQQLVHSGEMDWGQGEKEEIKGLLETAILKGLNKTKEKKRIFFMNRSAWWAAASFAVLAGMAFYFMFQKKHRQTQRAELVKATDDVQAPQSNRALVTLANGKTVYLDSLSNGATLHQGNTTLLKSSSGEIEYQLNGSAIDEIQYNTLLNPRGSRVISMLLTDGTKVWLNAGSSLIYPVVFTGSKREVTVTGEAYFEVAPDRSKQFIVHKGSMAVMVMGTHFNVNAFEDDDKSIKVTLLEGAVKVKNGSSNGTLKPGQQAWVHDDVKVVNNVNLEKVMAWKNGYFQFDKASLQSVLKQVARWYDVDVIYEGSNSSRVFVGEIERDLNLSEILRILELNKVSFTIKGKKLFVKPD